MSKHFNWMVIDHVDKQGMWFWSTKTHIQYVFFWNPIKMIYNWIYNWDNCPFGWSTLCNCGAEMKNIKI